MSEDEKKLAIALPGEWALHKIFGPALTEIGEDFKKLYAVGRDKIIAAACKKIEDPDDGKKANLRVMRDVLWSGAFTEDEVCAEYFGGVLAASRSDDGKGDDAIQFVDVIKSLSAKQLQLHYTIYNSLNKAFVAEDQRVNVGKGSEVTPKQVWFSSIELLDGLGLLATDLNILQRQGLIYTYETNRHELNEGQEFSYANVNPTTFGVLLYAAVHDRLGEWRSFDQQNFGDFDDVLLPQHYALTLDGLLKSASLSQPPPQIKI